MLRRLTGRKLGAVKSTMASRRPKRCSTVPSAQQIKSSRFASLSQLSSADFELDSRGSKPASGRRRPGLLFDLSSCDRNILQASDDQHGTLQHRAKTAVFGALYLTRQLMRRWPATSRRLLAGGIAGAGNFCIERHLDAALMLDFD